MRSLFLASALAVAAAQPTSCSGTPNNLPIWEGNPVLVNKTTNGLKYIASPANVTPPVTVLHVYGTQYEMGFAYGELMAQEINTLIPLAMQYLNDQINQSLPNWVPAEIRDIILEYGVEFALNLTYELTKPYTPAYHYETLQGMADGAGVDFMTIARVSMIPELIKAECSIMGAWGPATAQTSSGLVQLRALDWGTDGPFQMFPLLITWHPNAGNGYPFTALSWAGMLGAITGYSSTGMGISEKVWDAYTGARPMTGYVWNFLLQDILQFDWDTDLALSRIATANRTCSIWVGLGDQYANSLKIVGYSNQLVQIWNDRNFPNYTNHDLFNSLIYLNKHVQPSEDACMNDLMHYYYGQLDPVTTVRYVTALAQTGNMHIAVYDFENQYMYVSNAGVSDAHGNAVPAYNRPFLRFDAGALWKTTLTNY